MSRERKSEQNTKRSTQKICCCCTFKMKFELLVGLSHHHTLTRGRTECEGGKKEVTNVNKSSRGTKEIFSHNLRFNKTKLHSDGNQKFFFSFLPKNKTCKVTTAHRGNGIAHLCLIDCWNRTVPPQSSAHRLPIPLLFVLACNHR